MTDKISEAYIQYCKTQTEVPDRSDIFDAGYKSALSSLAWPYSKDKRHEEISSDEAFRIAYRLKLRMRFTGDRVQVASVCNDTIAKSVRVSCKGDIAYPGEAMRLAILLAAEEIDKH